jgi:hypothetical protein
MLPRVRALALALFSLAGCANHVRFADEVREHETRTVTRAATRIETREAVVGQPSAELTLSADEVAQVRHRETLVRLDEETPWRATNELWEVPTGLVVAPFFVALRASDKLLLGLIPDSVIDNGTDFGFAALNPAMNVESEERLRGREVSRRSHELESHEERDLRPLPDTELSVSLGEGPSSRVRTDASGHARVELLALLRDTPASTPRVLHVEVAGDGLRAPAVLELPLARQLSTRLIRAARARDAARKPGVSPDSVAQALVKLDQLGFPESALALERELRDRQHANAGWLLRLDLALEDD